MNLTNYIFIFHLVACQNHILKWEFALLILSPMNQKKLELEDASVKWAEWKSE